MTKVIRDAPETIEENSFVARLAQFFPSAIKVRIPVEVFTSRMPLSDGQSPVVAEHTVIEFGTEREVIFASALPLDFDDNIWLKNVDGSLQAQASVVAVRLGEKKNAVAVRFTEAVANWIIKPA